jgi:hypothetical protein
MSFKKDDPAVGQKNWVRGDVKFSSHEGAPNRRGRRKRYSAESKKGKSVRSKSTRQPWCGMNVCYVVENLNSKGPVSYAKQRDKRDKTNLDNESDDLEV